MAPPAPSTTLALRNVSKTFPGVRALTDVTFEVREGEVHALLGENGAGKSTLMAVAAGAIAPDSGTVEIGGRRLEQALPALAQELGLSVVYQHASVLGDLTVLENLLFALPAARRPSHNRAPAWARERLAAVGAEIDPSLRAEELSVAERQLLEIAKALVLDSRVLVLDEPTESLTAAESEYLFERIDELRRRGASVVYISHRLPEVRRIADRITVLRDGEVRGTALAREVSDDEILQMIVGRPVSQAFPEKTHAALAVKAPPVLLVEGLRGPRLHDVGFEIAPGEIVGFAGVEGNGQREALRALAGLLVHRGQVSVRGRPADTRTPGRSRRSGICYLPRDRHAEGIFASMSVRENLSLLMLRELSTAGVLKRRRELRATDAQIRSYAVKTPSGEAPISTLSGGNQQKVLIARTMAAEPDVLLFDEPTRGVDVGARMEIYRLLRAAADAGRAVVLVSSDALELQGLCDTVIVFSRGRVVRRLRGDEITEAAITGAAITADVQHVEHAPETSRARFARLRRSDLTPSAVIAALVFLLALVTDVGHPLFLGTRDVTSLLFLASILVLVSMGQLTALMAASFDLSVGPLIGLTVVILSFFLTPSAGYTGLLVGGLVAAGVGLGVGATNALLIHRLRIGPVISTLVTYIALQGVSLLLRPQPAGSMSFAVTAALQQDLGPIPVVFVVAVVVAVVAELLLRRSAYGRELRAVGSDAVRAFRVGARPGWTLLGAHLLCSLFAVLAGILLAGVVGIGDPTLGSDYTLTSIAAAVLGGASIFGGRGSYVGAFLGAVLLQEVINATTFLGLAQAWQEWLPGALIVLGAGLYSRLRAPRSASRVSAT